MKKIASLIIIVLITVSCNETKKENSTTNTNKTEVAANYKSIELEIEGMTCEIGCARLIQSKLSKVDGIVYTKVDFESEKGIFTYDSNKLTKEDIALNVNKIAGGDLYSVTKTKELDSIIEKKEEKQIKNNKIE
jgi:mercuric ion binding protein